MSTTVHCKCWLREVGSVVLSLSHSLISQPHLVPELHQPHRVTKEIQLKQYLAHIHSHHRAS
jgi:hypothetical protein